ncbi:MAG: phage tail protein [Sandaracinaceae bacterium]|nr:phage tail protein [Sandaracinaceae bacterium]
MAVVDDLRRGARAARLDPFTAFNFLITLVETSDRPQAIVSNLIGVIRDVALGGFKECSGLEMTLDVEERQEGGNNGAVLKFPTRMKWSNLRLKKGVGLSDDLWNWHYEMVEGNFGRRRDGVIILQNELHIPIKAWHFRRGLPIKWTGPSFDATRGEVAFEEIEIAHEGLQLLSLSSLLEAGTGVSV